MPDASPPMFYLVVTYVLFTYQTSVMSFDIVTAQISICWKIINGAK